MPAQHEIDTLYLHGNVVTMDEANPRADAVATAGERIVAVGQASELRELAGPTTRVVELGGRTMIPGFVEPHTHGPIYSQEVFDSVNLRCPPLGVVDRLGRGLEGDVGIAGRLFDVAHRGAFGSVGETLDARGP